MDVSQQTNLLSFLSPKGKYVHNIGGIRIHVDEKMFLLTVSPYMKTCLTVFTVLL